MELEDAEGEWSVAHVIPISSLPYNETKPTYVLMEFPESGGFPSAQTFKVAKLLCKDKHVLY